MAPPALALLLTLCWAAAAAPLQDACEQELNKIKDLLQVSCVGRGLTGPPAGLPPDTGILLLSDNRLARLSLAAFGHLRNLTDLDLASNGLAALEPDAPLPALQQLSLARNALRSLPVLRGLSGLRRLALGHNALARLPDGGFRALPRLQDLELQGNRLRRLPAGAFAGLAELRDLDLSDNALEALPPALLAGLEALQILRLERNRLRAVPDGFFQENLFAYVYLRGNPWHCDCRLRYLRDWIADNELSVYTRLRGPEKETTEHDPDGVVCSAPPERKGSPVTRFQAACRDPGDGEGGAQEEDPGSSSTGAPPPLSTPARRSASPPPSGPALPSPAARPGTAAPPTPSGPALPSTASRPGTAAPPTPSGPALPSTASRPGTAAPPTPSGPALPSPAARPDGLTRAVSSSAAGLPPAGPTATPTERGTASPPATPRTSEPPSTGGAGLLRTAPRRAATSPAPGRPGPTALPSRCLCPAEQVGALQAPTGQRPPAPRARRLSALCCLPRLALYAACLALGSLPVLLGGCCWARAALSGRLRALPGSPPAGRRQLRQGAPSGAGGAGPPTGRRLYYVCKEFQLAPASHVAWLLISLPGPAGRRRCGRGPALGGGTDGAGAASAS